MPSYPSYYCVHRPLAYSFPSFLLPDVTIVVVLPRFVVEYTSSAQEALRRMVHRHLLGAAAYDARLQVGSHHKIVELLTACRSD